MTDPLLYIIVLSNLQLSDSFACLTSLTKSNYKNFQVILLNRVSEKDSVEKIHQNFPDVQVVSITQNLGYAGNNNIGIKVALEQGADWILLLNDDTVLDPACLSLLMRAGEADSAVGIIGPMVYHYDEPGIIQSAGGLLGKYWQSIHLGKNEVDHGQFEVTREVEWISGCAIMVCRTLIEQVGMLDDNYFLYWEEIEWCIRARRAGWKIIHVPEAKIWHKGVQSNYQPKSYVTYYTTRNYLFTLAKHRAPFYVRLLAYLNILQTLLSWSVKPRWRSKREHRNAMWRGIVDFFWHRLGPMTF